MDTEGTLTGQLQSVNVIVKVVETYPDTTTTPSEVRIGSTINGFFLSVFMIGATGAPVTGSLNWYLMKRHSDQTTVPVAGTTGISDLRSQIIHEEKGLAGSGDGTPMAFKGVIAIPRGMRRNRIGDEWILVLRNLDATVDTTFCLKAIYKSYY